MRNISFLILSVLLFIVAVLLLLVYNELAECSESYVVSAIVATILSILPPMFYRSSVVPKKIVMVVHIVFVTVASHLLSVVWSEIFYDVCKTKGSKDTVLLYSSIIVVSYAMITVAGHFMKREKDSYETVKREDI